MGWSSGSEVMQKVIESVLKNVDDERARYNIYKDVMECLEDCDCDTLDECLDVDDVYDKLYFEKNERN